MKHKSGEIVYIPAFDEDVVLQSNTGACMLCSDPDCLEWDVVGMETDAPYRRVGECMMAAVGDSV
jgi:hypothetical protein